MALLQQENWIVWLWICSMLCYTAQVSDTCQTEGLSHVGGAATTADELSYGCHNGCPTTEPQVHVVVQTSSRQPYEQGQGSQVIIHIKDNCQTQIPMKIILISHVPLNWAISLDEGGPLTSLEVIIYTQGDVDDIYYGGIVPHRATKKSLYDLYHSGTELLSTLSSKYAVKSTIDRLKENHGINYVTSINVADYLSPWTLISCCRSQTPLSTSRPTSTVTPVVNPSTSNVTFTTISTTDTSPIIPRNETQADQQEADNIPLVAGLVSLLVVVAAAIAGIAFCLYTQKTKRSLTSGTSPSTDPNIYSESPTVTDSNGITRDNPPPSYAEVEYEEAATVKPPVIPPRAKRP